LKHSRDLFKNAD